MRYPEHDVLFFFGYLFRMGVGDQPGIDIVQSGVYASISRYTREKKQTACKCKTLGIEPTTSCTLSGISYRYATSVHTLVIFVVRTRYFTLSRTTTSRGCAAQAPGPGPRDGGTARALISPGPRSPHASLSPGPQHACSHARLRTEARPARPARLRDRPLLLAHKSFRLLSTPSGL